MINSFITVNYHYVRPIKNSKNKNIKGLEIKEFIKQLNFLKKNYNIISAYDIKEFLKNNQKIPKKSCLLTFDDGYKDHYKYVMPELIKRKLSGCFFPSAENILNHKVTDTNKIHFILDKQKSPNTILLDINTFLKKNHISLPSKKVFMDFEKKFFKRHDNKKIKFIKYLLQSWIPVNYRSKCCTHLFNKYLKIDEKEFSKNLYLSFKEIKDMIKNGMTFGGHGYKHIRLGELDFKNQLSEINKMIIFLKKFKINKDWIMCYPYGSFNNDTISILKKKNCLYGFSADPGKSILNKKNIFKMNRYDTNDLVY